MIRLFTAIAIPPEIGQGLLSRQHGIEGDPGHHPQLAGLGHRTGQPPAGHPDTHATLDDHREDGVRHGGPGQPGPAPACRDCRYQLRLLR